VSIEEASRQADFLAPPTYGSVLRLQAGVTAAALDITSMAGWVGNQVSGGDGAGPSSNAPNPIGHYVTIQVDSGVLWVTFADTYAHAAAVDASATVSTVNGSGTASAAFTPAGGMSIPAGNPWHFKIPPGQNPHTTPYGASSKCRYLGFITNNATVNFTIFQSSP
jgi:hypothetical protein